MTETDSGAKSAARDTWYLIAVGGLLIVIVASLAALWLMERNRRVDAERRLAEAGQGDPLAAALSQMGGVRRLSLPGAGPGGEIPISELVDVRTVELGGQPRKLWVLSSEAGGRLGLEPGRLYEVADPPATQPAAEGL
jgi:hypothetical protein